MSALAQHWSVIRSAWAIDTELSRNRAAYRQTEFLPAALEVIETPASPFGRIGLWFLICAVAAALLWSFISKLDVVVVAPGRIIPVDRVKTIQPTELGVVRTIYVRDGQSVNAGQLLIDLDPTTSGADDAQARTGLEAAELDRARSQTILEYLRSSRFSFAPPVGTSVAAASIQRDLVHAKIEEYKSRRGILLQQRREREAELAAARAEEAKLRETLPLLEKQLAARQSLADKGYYSRLRVFEIEEQRIERLRNMDVQRASASKASAAIAGIDNQLSQIQSELRQGAVQDLADARDNATLRSNEIEKTAYREGLMRLRSPIDGTVQQLAVHTRGGVVQAADPLMVIVPKHSQLMVEARVLNKDVALLRAGQTVRVKVDAFPFTDFGTLDATLDSVSRDAIEDEKLGLVYMARIRLPRAPKMAGGRSFSLSPGMTVNAEIMAAKRRVIQYLLSPIAVRLDEAGRER